MAKSAPKLTLNSSRDIPLDRLVLSQSNVRRVKAGVSIDALADDIARRKLLQSLNVRPILDDTGQETGRYEVPAGGRRYRAIELLVKRKLLAKDTRSEEHTSELQSLMRISYAVFCLKKK